MSGFGGRNGNRHALRIAHLADHQHVRRLAQRCPKSGGKIGRVGSNLDLLDDAAQVRVLVFDRIFDGHDMTRIALIDLVDQRRQRRRFAGAGRASDQHQPATKAARLPTSTGSPNSPSDGTFIGSARIVAAA